MTNQTNQKREQNTGRYAPAKLESWCECGHTLGEHCAIRGKWDGKTEQPCFTGGGDQECDCKCFKKVKLPDLTESVMNYRKEKGQKPYSQFNCMECEQPLDFTKMVWLELNCRTGEYARPGTAPWSDKEGESQGCFQFGPDCARKLLRQSAPMRAARGAK